MTERVLRIVTNNPWIERNVSAPLPPNVPIMRGPYRSLVIEKNDRQYDKEGLIALHKARERYIIERNHPNLPTPGEDFGIIDRQMLQRSLRDAMLLDLEEK